MNLYLRLIWIMICSFFKSAIHTIEEPSILEFTVLPNDLDLNLHMNNGRYLTIMDLGRLDYIVRSGVYKKMLKRKSIPVLSAAQMRYRLPLMPFRRYKLITNIICWDEKWVYMRQDFIIKKGEKAGAIAASGLLKGSFYDKRNKQTVPTEELLSVFYKGRAVPPSPDMPDYIQQWQEAEQTHRDALN